MKRLSKIYFVIIFIILSSCFFFVPISNPVYEAPPDTEGLTVELVHTKIYGRSWATSAQPLISVPETHKIQVMNETYILHHEKDDSFFIVENEWDIVPFAIAYPDSMPNALAYYKSASNTTGIEYPKSKYIKNRRIRLYNSKYNYLQYLPLPCEHFTWYNFMDINLDGYTDIVIELTGSERVHPVYEFFIWDTSTNTFKKVAYEGFDEIESFYVYNSFIPLQSFGINPSTNARGSISKILVWDKNTLVLEKIVDRFLDEYSVSILRRPLLGTIQIHRGDGWEENNYSYYSYVNVQDNDYYNQNVADVFYLRVFKGKPSAMRTMEYTMEEELIITDIRFDGKTYEIAFTSFETYDNIAITREEYKYLVAGERSHTDNGMKDYYLSNEQNIYTTVSDGETELIDGLKRMPSSAYELVYPPPSAPSSK
jgi:hypothetical protein